MTAMAGAQELTPQNSERLRKKIDSVNLIYRRTLLCQYEEYIASLKQDIDGVRKSRAEVGDASAAARELDAGIERLTADLKAAEEKATALEAEVAALTVEASEQRTEQAPAPKQAEQRPGGCDAILSDVPPPVGTSSADRFPADRPPAGAIWCGEVGVDTGPNANEPKLTVQMLAERAAPILWFSPDEPLRQSGSESVNIPEALPGDGGSLKDARVYYRVSRIIDEEIEKPNAANREFDNMQKRDELALKSLNEITVRYYFYYSKDEGFEGHWNDLESLRLDISFTRLNEKGGKPGEGEAVKYYVAHIKTAVGAAHGVSWYRNQLNIGDNERDVSLPLTVLVEEGKHATSPDRNADGLYSPGYDVNIRYNDAWGVRDLIGSGQLGSAHYEGSMTKQRRPDGMVFPRVWGGADRAELLKHYRGSYRDAVLAAPAYELKRITTDLSDKVKTAEDELKKKLEADNEDKSLLQRRKAVKKGMGLNLLGLMEREHFKEKAPQKGTGDDLFWKAAKKGLGFERGEEALDALTFGYRYDGQHGFTISPPLGRPFLSFLGVYALPKLNIMPTGPEKHWSLEGLFTPSASRTFDWYVSTGPEWFRPLRESGYDTRFAAEGGLRFRFRYKMFIGGRLGIRTTNVRQPRDPRLVFEFGPGAF